MFKIVSLLLSAAAVAASGGHVSSSSLLNEDILEVVASDSSNFETLHAAVEIAGLSDTLKSDGPFTFFAPNEHAFKLLGEETLKQLFANPDELREMLLYHILPGAVIAKEDIKEGAMQTAQGGSIHVSLTGYNTVLNDDADIITFDVLASNGVIHVIDRFLLPSYVPSSISASRELAGLPTMADLVSSNTGLTTLNTALKATGLGAALAVTGPYTLFAPTDKAFAKLGQSRVAALLKNPTSLSEILYYHMLRGSVLQKDVKTGVINAANNKNLLFRVQPRGGVVINNSANVTTFNITANNGVIHLIDTVLFPPKNLMNTILTDSRFSTLAAAVKAAGLINTLKDVNKDFTIFAPTNTAFDALGTKVIQSLLREQNTLKIILLHHVVDGSVLKNDLKKIGTSGNVTTVQGSKLKFNFTGDALVVGNAKVIQTGILASNGVIHVIDKVLIPK